MSATVTAIYDKPQNAIHAVDELVGMGVDKEHVSVVMNEQLRQDLAPEVKGTINANTDIRKGDKSEEGAAAGAAIGGAAGAIIAAATGGLGAAVLPGFVIAGPILTGLAGAGAGGVAGGLVGLIAGTGIPETEAKVFSDRVKNGGVLVAAKAEQVDKSKIKKVMEKNGGNLSKSFSIS